MKKRNGIYHSSENSFSDPPKKVNWNEILEAYKMLVIFTFFIFSDQNENVKIEYPSIL